MLHPTAAGTAFLGSEFVVGFTRTAKKNAPDFRETSPKSAGRSKTLYMVWDLILRHPELEDVYYSLLLRPFEERMSTNHECEKKKYHVGLEVERHPWWGHPAKPTFSSRQTSQQETIAEKFLRSNNEAQ